MDWRARAPFIVGIIGIAGLGAYLTVEDAGPSPLASAHAQLEDCQRLWGCASCHTERGLAAGCLGCHAEIEVQLAKEAGYHASLLAGKEISCSGCHLEHLGSSFPLTGRHSWGSVDPDSFRHHHVAFHLAGKHGSLKCRDCHAGPKTPPLALPGFASTPRAQTYLGLEQKCASCHDDPHAGGLSPACESCHSQDAFRPASHFRHEDHFRLEGAHATAACARCHVIPEQPIPERGEKAAPLTFKAVRGTRCVECHESPHRTGWRNEARWRDDCGGCHLAADPGWNAAEARLTPAQHAVAGFRLEPPHTKAECAQCHPPGATFAARHPDPGAPGYARREGQCAGCHRDVHAGQFGAAGDCLRCHERTRWQPTSITATNHPVLLLSGAHFAVSCQDCHRVDSREGVRRFAGTSRACKSCHQDPHGGQFDAEPAAGDCDQCHRQQADTFAIRPFDHAARAGYALTGAHATAGCDACHTLVTPAVASLAPARFRAYRETPTACGCCHVDPHAGQFRVAGKTACERCHPSTVIWKQSSFDHTRDSKFALDGIHSRVACAECHPRVRKPGGETFVQFKPIGTRCQDCHAFEQD